MFSLVFHGLGLSSRISLIPEIGRYVAIPPVKHRTHAPHWWTIPLSPTFGLGHDSNIHGTVINVSGRKKCTSSRLIAKRQNFPMSRPSVAYWLRKNTIGTPTNTLAQNAFPCSQGKSYRSHRFNPGCCKDTPILKTTPEAHLNTLSGQIHAQPDPKVQNGGAP